MSRRTRFTVLAASASLLVGAIVVAAVRTRGPADYVPVAIDGRQQLVDDPTLLTPPHLDRLEVVLRRYGEWYQRVDRGLLRVSRRVADDRDLLWNYTSKAEAEPPAGGRPPAAAGEGGG